MFLISTNQTSLLFLRAFIDVLPSTAPTGTPALGFRATSIFPARATKKMLGKHMQMPIKFTFFSLNLGYIFVYKKNYCGFITNIWLPYPSIYVVLFTIPAFYLQFTGQFSYHLLRQNDIFTSILGSENVRNSLFSTLALKKKVS